jgi:hypothetical protein
MKSSKRIKKSIFHEEPKSQQERRQMLPGLNGLILEEARRQALYDETVKKAAVSFVDHFNKTLKTADEMLASGELEPFESDAAKFKNMTQVVVSFTILNILVPMTKNEGKIGALQCLGMIHEAIELINDVRFDKSSVGPGFFKAYVHGKFPETFKVIWGD